ncbi:MAG: folate-binding protein YgfZ [Chloroflexi bacterium]|nr:folate-binding protein YgfZ [Chloroflexota bacterium]
MSKKISETIYQAAHEKAILVDRSNLGMLKFSGETRLDLIHRMSTNQINGLQSGEGVATILTSDIARIIDRLILYASSDTVYCLTSENNADNIARYLMRFVFFNDDFHIEDLSADTAVFAIYGPQTKELLTAVGFPNTDLPLHHWRQVELDNVTAYLHRTDPINGNGYFVMSQTKDRDALWQMLLDGGLVTADEAAFEFLRIEAGLPRYGRELTLDYIPLEANLWNDVSFSKGCYIGQEIIARMESRGKLAKQLTRLHAAAPIEAGANVLANGKNGGAVTSVAAGLDGFVALGYVKTAVLDANTELTVGETAVTLYPHS